MERAKAKANEILEDLRRGGVTFRAAMVEHDGWVALHGADITRGIPAHLMSQMEKWTLVDVEGNEQERVIFRVTREELLKNTKSRQRHGEPI